MNKSERYIDIYKRYNNVNIFKKMLNYSRYMLELMTDEEEDNYYWYMLWKSTNRA